MDERESGREHASTDTVQFPARPAGATLVLVGLAHLLAPTALLRTARLGYRYVLRVEFDPKPGASGRVRAIGFAMVATGAHLLYHGGIRPQGSGQEE